jgi:predicted dienelactone hydrolase
MSYDPFARGGFPVGVRTLALEDAARARRLAVECWYPAADAHAGQDLSPDSQDRYRWLAALPPVAQEAVRDAAPRAGRFRLVVFSHGFSGHRRQTTHLCTHLASHGYVVAAVDHTGNTTQDVVQQVLAARLSGAQIDPAALLEPSIAERPRDVSFAIDRLLEGAAPGLSERIEGDAVGVAGHSFGGWTALMATGRDRRIAAALALAPAGGASPLPDDPMARRLDLDWPRPVPTLFVAAEHDSILPLAGVRALYERTRGAERLVVLENADHFHFCDRAAETHELYRASLGALPAGLEAGALSRARPFAEHCSGESAYRCTRALGLALMDARLAGSDAARAFLAGDLSAALAERGVAVRCG